MNETQIEVLFALMDGIEKAASAEVQSLEAIRRLASAARDILAKEPIS